MSVDGVNGCIEDIIYAYQEACNVLSKVKSKRARKGLPLPDTAALDESLQQCPYEIHLQREQTLASLAPTLHLAGLILDAGDTLALETLRQIRIDVRGAMFESLVDVLQNDQIMDLSHVSNASERGKHRTVQTIVELQSRLSPTSNASSPLQIASPVDIPSASKSRPVRPNSITSTASSSSAGQGRQEEQFSPSYFPKFSLNKWKRRSRSEASQQQNITSHPTDISSPNLEPSSRGVSEAFLNSHRRTTSETSRPTNLALSTSPSSWTVGGGECVDSTAMMSATPTHFNVGDHPTSSNATWNLPIPTEANQYLGFCRGAWKMQNGSSSAMKTRYEFNSGWSQSKVPYLQCSANKCAFACRLPEDKIESVWRSSKGIAFRWRFLAKSHAPQVRVENELYAYLCTFCVLSGAEASIYFGTDVLLEHLAQHDVTHLPREVLYRARCIADRVAGDEEDFDVNLYPRNSESRRKASATLSDALLVSPPAWQREHAHSNLF